MISNSNFTNLYYEKDAFAILGAKYEQNKIMRETMDAISERTNIHITGGGREFGTVYYANYGKFCYNLNARAGDRGWMKKFKAGKRDKRNSYLKKEEKAYNAIMGLIFSDHHNNLIGL